MPKPSLGDVAAAVLDPMLSDNFLLEFPAVPSGESAVPLRMMCRTAVKPGVTINSVEVQLYGHTLEYAGNLTYSHDLQVEYIENRSAQISKILEGWADIIRDHRTQHGSFKEVYAKSAYLTIFDQKGTPVRKYTIFGCWPSMIPDLNFDGSSANIITLSVGFKYDYWEVTS